MMMSFLIPFFTDQLNLDDIDVSYDREMYNIPMLYDKTDRSKIWTQKKS